MKASIVVAQLPVSWDVEENLAAITDVDWRAQAVSTGCPRTSAEAISPSVEPELLRLHHRRGRNGGRLNSRRVVQWLRSSVGLHQSPLLSCIR